MCVLATGVSLEAEPSPWQVTAAAAERMLEAATDDDVPVLLEVGDGKRRPATVLAAAGAKEVERQIRKIDPEATVAARGRICAVRIDAGERAAPRAAAIVELTAATGPVAVVAAPGQYRRVAEGLGSLLDLILLLPPEQPGSGDQALTELTRVEATEIAGRVEVMAARPGRLAARRAQ